MSEIHYLSASALAAAIRERRISSREALEALVARVERHDRPLNLVVTLDLERARRDAAGRRRGARARRVCAARSTACR